MAIPKIVGTETEFGITIRKETQFDPISASILLVNSYQQHPAGNILWDYDLENPLADARGFELDEEITPPSQKENLAINKILPQPRFQGTHRQGKPLHAPTRRRRSSRNTKPGSSRESTSSSV